MKNIRPTAILLSAVTLFFAGHASAVGPTACDGTNSMPVLSARYGMSLPYSDPDGGTMSFTLLSGPVRGSLERWAGGGHGTDYDAIVPGVPVSDSYWYYTATGTDPGTDSFTWEVSDGTATSGVATMTIVLTTNTPMTAASGTNSMAVGSVRGWLWLNYTDPDWAQPKTFQLVSGPSRGLLEYESDTNWVSIASNDWVGSRDWRYTPSGTNAGTDSFVWRGSDGLVTTEEATVVIDLGTNMPPTAADQDVSLAIGSVRHTIWLSYTDYDWDQPKTSQLITPPVRGTLECSSGTNYVPVVSNEWVDETTWYYTPSGVETGTDSFVWRVSDGIETTDTATVSITITTNSVPKANNQSMDLLKNSVRRYFWLSYSHNDSYQPITFFMVTPPSSGTAEYISATNYVAAPTNTAMTVNSWYYTPNPDFVGEDSVQWTVSDGISTSAVATYAFNVTSNRPPVAYDIRAVTAPGTNVNLAAKYADPDSGQTRTAHVVQNAGHGNVTAAGTTFTYTPTNGFKGVDSFTYKVNDGEDDSNIATGLLQVRDADERAGNLVILVVHQTLYPNISNEVERLKTDLTDEGYTSKVHLAATGITASNLWSYLRGEYDNTNQWLVGAILIGNLPKAYLDGSHKCDLVYWNMEQFQTSGSVSSLQIWVTRLYVSGTTYGTEVDLIKRALDSNHDCRKGISRLPHKACFYHAWESYACYGTNLLQVWPSVAITNEVGGDHQSKAKFMPWRADIGEAGADALVAGGDMFQETSHGNSGSYMNGAFGTSDLFRLIAQQRSCMIESCTSGDFGGIVNHHVFTRGGGCIFAVGGTEINYVGDFQAAGASTGARALRALLNAGESWGSALLVNYIFSARNRTVYYGDLSLPAMASSSNDVPVIESVSVEPAVPLPGLPATFSMAVSDPDAADSDSPYADYEHRVEWFMAGYNSGRNDPTYVTNDAQCATWTNATHAFPAAGSYSVRVEVMDEWRARGWKELTVTVNTPPSASNDAATVEAYHAVAVPVLANDTDADGHALSLDAVLTQPSHGSAVKGVDAVIYTSTNAWEGVDTFTYRVKDTLNGSATGTVSVTVLVDTTGPALVRAWSWGDSNAVWALFDEPVEPGWGFGGAENTANYALNYGVGITGAIQQADGKTVKLQTTDLLTGLDYVLTVNNVRDTALGSNAIRAGSQAALRHLPADVTVWVDDSVPGGATTSSDGGDAWTWVTASPAPYWGAKAHLSNIYSGEHQHRFYSATQTLAVATGEVLFAYVHVDPENVPQELMLQFREGSSFEHRAYWGQNMINWGTAGTVSRTNMGALPVAGQWVRLEAPASAVGVEGKTLNGMAFTLYGGRAAWDCAGKCAGTFQPQVDFDGDGMSDNWEIAHFGGTGASDGDADYDHDGMTDRQEYLAGTDPKSDLSLLSITGFEPEPGSNFVIRWRSVAGKRYGVWGSTNLVIGFDDLLSSWIPAEPPVNAYTVTVDQAGTRFYRIVVELE